VLESQSEDLNEIQSDIGMDLSEQDEDEAEDDEEDDIDIAKALIQDYQEDEDEILTKSKCSLGGLG
jgi:hypothetical protein